jgi:hypothetical protein
MKKSTKPAKSPAPATKSVSKKAPAAPTAKVSAAKPTKKIAAKPAKAAAPVVTKAAAKPAAKSEAKPAVKPVAPALVTTSITATIDIGFGNALYLRGEGAGLSWDRGVLMNCVANDCWSHELSESARPLIYKFLVNDLTWSAGEDYTAPAGKNVAVVPTFP